MTKTAPLLPFPQLLFPRLRKALTRLAQAVWQDPVPLTVMRTESRTGEFPFVDAEALAATLKPVDLPLTWRAPGFSTTWFRVSLPEGYQLRPGDHIHWDDNAETTVWLAGEPLFGLDATHRQWPWPAEARELWLESIFCQSGIWHAAAKGIGPAGSLLSQARIVRKDEEAWQAYFDLEVLTDWLEEEVRRIMPQEAEQLLAGFRAWPEMDSASSTFLPDGVGTGVANRWRPDLDRLPPLHRRVMRELEEAISTYHNQGTAALRERLKGVYARLRESGTISKAVLTGHAHIDLVWLWPEATGEQKTVRTFATVDALLERYPEFHFGYSQPASYAAARRRSPGLMKRVDRRISGGRWEPTGAMYVEADTLMPCGEALLRCFLIGQRQFVALQGAPSPVLWLPDAFGFSGSLPTVMKLAGVDYFFTNKLSWNMINRFPHSSFRWRGLDGSEVLAHVSRATGYNNPARPRNLRLESEANRQSDVHDEFLLPCGWGDGGGGPTADIIERVRRQKDLRNQPAAEWGRIDAFYQRLSAVRDELPVWRGEIYLEAHRGTLTTQGEVKAAYRRLECALRALEAAHCATGAGPVDVQAWERLAFVQFHDCLPGSSIHEVYEAIIPEADGLTKRSLAAVETVMKSLDEGATGTAIFNPLPLPLALNVDDDTVVIPPLATVDAQAAARRPKASPTISSGLGLWNGLIEAEFAPHGGLQRLQVEGRNMLAGSPRFVAYRDVPYDLEAWEIDRGALAHGRGLTKQGETVATSGPGWRGFRETWVLGESVVNALWRLRSGANALELEIEADWKEPEVLLKFEVPTIFRGQSALFGSPFGGEWRSQHPGEVRQSAQWEAPASRWMMTADDGRQEGAFIVTEAKYGFSVRDGEMAVSLLKSAKVTETTAFPVSFRTGEARAKFSDLGRQTIRLGLGGLTANTPREGYPAAVAETLFARPIEVAARTRQTFFPSVAGLQSVIPTWCVPCGGGDWILRLNETTGRRGKLTITPPLGWVGTLLLRAEPGEGDRPLPASGEIDVAPFAVLSVRFSRG